MSTYLNFERRWLLNFVWVTTLHTSKIEILKTNLDTQYLLISKFNQKVF